MTASNRLQIIIQWAETLSSTKPFLEPESQPLNLLPVNHKVHKIMGVSVCLINKRRKPNRRSDITPHGPETARLLEFLA